MNPLRVYVAGPYSRPSPAHNTRQAIETANEILARGMYPFLPHLSLLWDTVTPKPYELWLAYDLVWVRSCDALFRMPGDSPGADREEAEAVARKKPVFRDMAELVKWAERIRYIAEIV